MGVRISRPGSPIVGVRAPSVYCLPSGPRVAFEIRYDCGFWVGTPDLGIWWACNLDEHSVRLVAPLEWGALERMGDDVEWSCSEQVEGILQRFVDAKAAIKAVILGV